MLIHVGRLAALSIAVASILMASAGVAHADVAVAGTASIKIEWFDMNYCADLPPHCALRYSHNESGQMGVTAEVGPPRVPTLGNAPDTNPFWLRIRPQDDIMTPGFMLETAAVVHADGPGFMVLPFWTLQPAAPSEWKATWSSPLGVVVPNPVLGSTPDAAAIATNAWVDLRCASSHTAQYWSSGYAPADWQGNRNTFFTATMAGNQTTIHFESWIGPVCDYGIDWSWMGNAEGYVTADLTFPGAILPATSGPKPKPAPPPPTPGPGPSDRMPPVTRALASSGRRGHLLHLKYRVRDDSHQTRDQITVYRGQRVIARISSGFGEANWSKVYYLTWRAPRQGTQLRFCVQSWDRAGNKSNRSCAQIKLQR